MSATDDYLTGVIVDRSLTADQKALVVSTIAKYLIAVTQTVPMQTQLLTDAANYRAGTKR